MNVLAFDTCFGACSAAILWHEARPGGNAPAERIVGRYEEMASGQAERLMPMIDEVLRESALAMKDLDAIGVTEGPGTFTGTRVGVAAARGLALATGLPIRSTTSLHVMAHRARAELDGWIADGVLTVCVDARAGQVFVQAFEMHSGAPLTEAAIRAPDAAAAICPDAPLLCVGSGAPAVAEAARRSGRQAVSRHVSLQPDARYLARIAATLPVRKPLVPLYMRPPDAKPHTGKSLPHA